MEITGRITADAQVRTVTGGNKVVNFSIALNDSYRNKQGERVQLTEYVECSYWNRTGIAEHLKKGLLVELAGRIKARAWIGSDGKPRSGLDFNTQSIKFLGGSKRENEKENVAKPKKKSQNNGSGKEDDDLPF